MIEIPAMRPRLPTVGQLAPYFAKIDEARTYTNYGPLACTLEERLAAHFSLPSGSVTTVANATLGLALALAAQAPPAGTLCILPAWTFVASAHAVTLAGLVPYFVDVDADSGLLDPAGLDELIAHAPGPVSAVMPVAAFGHPIDVAEWDRVRSRTGLAAVIDAAAAFDTLRPGETPAVVSLHATKIIGVGEGGFVASKNASLVRDVRARANFGFRGSRQAVAPATNAKLSEYHAAIGLAALDEWAAVRSEWMDIGRAYRAALPDSNRLRLPKGFAKDWITSTCVLSVAGADRAIENLAAAGIESRKWWDEGAHAHPATQACPRSALPNTQRLAGQSLGLPFFRGLATAEIDRIAGIVLAAN